MALCQWWSWCSSPLDLAVWYGHYDAAKLLIENGADMGHSDKKRRRTPVGIAIYRGYVDMVKMMVDHGAKVSIPMDCSVKHSAMIELLLDLSNTDINEARYTWFGTLLEHAVSTEATDTVRMLLSRGADPTIVSHLCLGGTLLHRYYGDDVDMVDLLVRSGVDMNATTEFKKTLLHQAAAHGMVKVANYLMEHRAIPTHVVNGGMPYINGMPSQIAEARGHIDLAARLREYEASYSS